MADLSRSLRSARILVTNDDGIHAPGLKALERVAKSLSKDVWTVAPEVEQSAASHSLTTRRPLRLRKFGAQRFAVDGTPTDCVLVAVHKVLADKRPALVLSGFNHGANLGEDITYSGTVAAAMEATALGIPAIALSQCRPAKGGKISFACGEAHAGAVIRKLLSVKWSADVLMNINFPARDPKEVTQLLAGRQGKRDTSVSLIEDVDPGGRPYLWIGDFPGDETQETDTDLAAIGEGAITVTPLHMDLTNKAMLKRLREALS